jgi:hypothetical protein
MSFDIIGDIHGHADELRELLTEMGYKERRGYFAHPTRQAIFVGDFIDRGPKILDALQIVQAMHKNKSALAIMGNHEFNAIAYHTEDLNNPGTHFRERNDKNKHQHQATLDQVELKDLRKFVSWFKTLPVVLELNGLRIVHACWDAPGIRRINQARAKHGDFTPAFLRSACDKAKKAKLYWAIEDVLKGKEMTLPEGESITDEHGCKRSNIRVRWFDSPKGATYRQHALGTTDPLPNTMIPPGVSSAKPYPRKAPPVIFGHYWLKATAEPEILTHNVACVDFSIAKGGRLTAYRWNGEQQLDNRNFKTVKSSSTATEA